MQSERGMPPRATRLGARSDRVLAGLLGLSAALVAALPDAGRVAGPG